MDCVILQVLPLTGKINITPAVPAKPAPAPQTEVVYATKAVSDSSLANT